MSLINNPLYKDDLLKVVEHTPDLKSLDGQSLLMIGASGMIGSFLVDTLMLANQYLGEEIVKDWKNDSLRISLIKILRSSKET